MSEMPAHWRWVTLNDLQADEPGAITDGPFGSNLTSAHYSTSGARVVRLQNIGDGKFNDAKAFIPKSHYESLRKHAVQPGDLLIASLGESLPRVCLAPDWLGPAVVKADCIRARLGSLVEPRWVMYALQTPLARKWASEQLHGVGRPRLGLSVIRALPIPLPPLKEQQLIVDLLEDQLSRLDAAAGSLDLARKRTMSAELSALDAFTRSGDLVPLGELVQRVEAGKSFGSASRQAKDGEWAIIKVSAMTWGKFNPNANKVVSDVSRVDRRYEIKQGDVLVSRANTSAYVGASVLVDSVRPRLLLSDKSLRVVPKPGVDVAYLHAVLRAPRTRAQISDMATGTKDSMRNISQTALLKVLVPSCASERQRFVVRRVESFSVSTARLRADLDRAQDRAQELKRSVLTAAFRGGLMVDGFGGRSVRRA